MMTRRSFLQGVGYIATGAVAVGLSTQWVFQESRTVAQGLNGNFCLRVALNACRRFLLLPTYWAECVIAVYTACVLAIIIGTQGGR